MIRVIFFSLLIFSCFSKGSTVVGMGAESRYEEVFETSESTSTSKLSSQPYFDIFAGTTVSDYLLSLEYFQGQSSNSGINILSLSQQRRGGWFSVQALGNLYSVFIPFFELGVGVIQDEVVTSYLGSTSTDFSDPAWASFVGAGSRIYLSGEGWRHLYLAFEARLLFGGNLTPQPNIAPLVKLGFTW
jgi:hypothetical protein